MLRSFLVPQTLPPIALESSSGPPSVATALARLLAQLGVRYAFGVVGGAIAQFCRALVQSDVRYMHFRHESGAAFAAVEASLALDRPLSSSARRGQGSPTH